MPANPVRIVNKEGIAIDASNPIPVSSVSVASFSTSTTTIASGQITVTTAGTAVQGPNVSNAGGFFLKADPDNTDAVFVGNDGAGDVTANNGFPLNTGETILVQVSNLNYLWFDADVSGEKIAWIKA